MLWLAELPSSTERAPHDDFWYEDIGLARSPSGQRVTPDKSLQLAAVYACVKVITDALMQIPLILYERVGTDDKQRARDDPRYALMHDQPNERYTAAEWREAMQHHVLLRGNAYAKRELDGAGRLEGLDDPYHPDHVKPELYRDEARKLRVRYHFEPRSALDRPERLLSDEVVHVRGLSLDGKTGISPIEAERHAIGLGLAAQDFLARYYANDARPGGIIESPKAFRTTEQREKFRESFENAVRGANRHRTAVLEFGMKYEPLELKLVDQQFLELRKYQNHEIARIFRVPPHMIMEMDRSTFSNIEHQAISFVKNTMMPWLVRWEQRLGLALLDEEGDERLFFEFLVDGLERGDTKTRSQLYHNGIQDGWLTRNEVRRKENMNSLEGLDEPLEPQNMRPAGEDPDANDDDALDDRVGELERNAAEAIARKQANELRRLQSANNGEGEDPQPYLERSIDDVARMMVLPRELAGAVMIDSWRDLRGGRPIDDWQERQTERLMQASRSL